MVKDFPGSTLSERKSDTVWTLITSDRTIPIKGHLFADWEELPDTEEGDLLWESLVRGILESPTDIIRAPNNAPCFHKNTLVKKFLVGPVPLSSIRRGDWILGDLRWTQVIGICHRSVSGGIDLDKERMTDGVWLKKGTQWLHPEGTEDNEAWSGIQLLTDSSEFMILLGETQEEFLVRDFTEVGFNRLPETYTRVEEAMIPPRT
jgi:hypothetical protein